MPIEYTFEADVSIPSGIDRAKFIIGLVDEANCSGSVLSEPKINTYLFDDATSHLSILFNLSVTEEEKVLLDNLVATFEYDVYGGGEDEIGLPRCYESHDNSETRGVGGGGVQPSYTGTSYALISPSMEILDPLPGKYAVTFTASIYCKNKNKSAFFMIYTSDGTPHGSEMQHRNKHGGDDHIENVTVVSKVTVAPGHSIQCRWKSQAGNEVTLTEGSVMCVRVS